MTKPPHDSGVDGLDSLLASDWSPPSPHHKANRHTSPRSSWSTCKVPGCDTRLGRAATWGVYCPKHKIADRRWGHPEQTMIMIKELDPYLKVTRGIRQRNKGANWPNIFARWQAVVAVAQELIDHARKGHAHVGYRREAAELITQIAGTVEDARVVDLVMAVYLVDEFEPGRFRSDEAFRACLLHAIRREAGAERRFDYKTGSREKASYRLLSAKTRETAARWLVEGLGLVGLHVARQERARVNAKEGTKAAYRDAVATIT
jgi:hypothetical protein